MTIQVSFYSYFKDLTGCAVTTQDAPAGSTISDLMKQIVSRYPKLQAMQKSMLIAVGVDYQTRDYVLLEGDQVSLFPPVQGG